jgi:hypothetical protein
MHGTIKILLAALLILASGYSAVGTGCLDNRTVQKNITLNGEMQNITIDCPYGCDPTSNDCYEVDTTYGILGVMAFLIFIVVMLWLAHYFKPKPEKKITQKEDGSLEETQEINLFMQILSFGFVGIAILTLGFLFSFIGGMGSKFTSSYHETVSLSLYQYSELWLTLSYLFIFGGLMAFIILIIYSVFRWYQYKTWEKKSRKDGEI